MPDRKPCVRCEGKGWYHYDELHSKPCEVCCDHRDGVWVLGPYHRDPGHYCCLSGCGETWPTEADYLADLPNEPIDGGSS